MNKAVAGAIIPKSYQDVTEMIHRPLVASIGVLLMISLTLITGCIGDTPEPPNPTNQATSATVLARVDGAAITTADLERAIINTPRPGQLEYINLPQRQELLEALINRKLMARQARVDGLDRDPAVAKSLETVANDPSESERILAGEYLDTQLAAGQVNTAAIEAYYRERPAEFTEAERVRVTRAVMPDEDTARMSRDWLLKGANAAELKTRAGGLGQVGSIWLQRRGEPGPMEHAAFALDPGEVSAVFPVHSGLAVLRVDERIPARLRPLSEVRAGIVARLNQGHRLQDQADLLARLRKNATVTIDQGALAAYEWQD